MVGIYVRSSVIKRHEAAPLRQERERFLSHRRAQGMSRHNVKALASTLLHVIRFLNLETPRPVTVTPYRPMHVSSAEKPSNHELAISRSLTPGGSRD
jgi:hypothetical protein